MVKDLYDLDKAVSNKVVRQHLYAELRELQRVEKEFGVCAEAVKYLGITAIPKEQILRFTI